MKNQRTSERDILSGKIITALCRYSDALGKQGKFEQQQAVQECLMMVHEAYYDNWGEPREHSIDNVRSYRADVTEG